MIENIDKNLRILIVDDSSTIQFQLKEMLETLGFYQLFFADDGLQAVKAIEKCHKDNKDIQLVLSDINMPGLNGIEFLQVARTHNPDLPIIMISAESSTTVVIKALDHGANQYILKPITEKNLIEKLIKTLL